MFILFIGLIVLTNACNMVEKTNCTIAMMECNFICEYAIMHPKYNDKCMACVMTTVKRCCDCLFPNWAHCNTSSMTWENKYYTNPKGNIKSSLCNSTYCVFRTFRTNDKQTIQCNKNQIAKCDSEQCLCVDILVDDYSEVKTNSSQQACAGAGCARGAGQICCPTGQEASCMCYNNLPYCTCRANIDKL